MDANKNEKDDVEFEIKNEASDFNNNKLIDYRKKTPNMLGTITEENSIYVKLPKKDMGNNDDEEDDPPARTFSNTF